MKAVDRGGVVSVSVSTSHVLTVRSVDITWSFRDIQGKLRTTRHVAED